MTFTGEVALKQAAVVTTPEPATFTLVGLGLVAFGGTLKRRRRPVG